MRYIPVVTIALAGIVHLLIAPRHYAHAPAHGLFFALIGLVQCAWAVRFWRRPSLLFYRVGLGLSGGLVILWLLTQTLGTPFGHGAESIDASAVVCKACEFIGLMSLVILAGVGVTAVGPSSISRRVGEALVLSFVVGLGFFGTAKVVEPWLPQWRHQPAQSGESEPAHTEHSHDEEHDEEEHSSPD